MKQKTTLTTLIIFLILMTSFSSCSLFKGVKGGDSIVLNYNLEVGQSFVITSSSSSEIITEQMGQTISIQMESASKMMGKSLGIQDDNSTRMEFQYTEMSQKMTSDIANGETDYSKIINKLFTLDLGAKGEIANYGGFDDFPTITNAAGEQINGEMFQQGFKVMFLTLPDEPVKVGSTWVQDVNSELPYGGSILKTSGTIEYEIIEKKEIDGLPCLVIESHGLLKTSGEFTQQGMDISIDRKNNSQSTIIFAYTKGLFISSESSGVTEGIVDIPVANMSIPQTIKSKSSYKVEFK